MRIRGLMVIARPRTELEIIVQILLLMLLHDGPMRRWEWVRCWGEREVWCLLTG
jgi:hypothetical protein